MKPLRPLAAVHHAPRKIVDDHDLPAPNEIMNVFLVEVVRPQGLTDVVHPGGVVAGIDVLNAEQFGDAIESRFRQRRH